LPGVLETAHVILARDPIFAIAVLSSKFGFFMEVSKIFSVLVIV